MVTLLPLPDSPTIPSTSPRLSSKDTPPTAFTSPTGVKKEVRRSSTRKRASSPAVMFPSALSSVALTSIVLSFVVMASAFSTPTSPLPMEAGYFLRRGSSASRRPSPRKLKASMVTEIAAAGKKSCHG